MNQIDFFGDLPPPRPFKDIRSTRSSSAEEKAQLILELGRLCQNPPESVRNGSINKTRDWVACQKVGKALCANSRASAVQLTSAIANMRRFIK